MIFLLLLVDFGLQYKELSIDIVCEIWLKIILEAIV